MSRLRLAVVCAGALALVAVTAFPPFMVIDRAAPQTRHAGLGHHPRWSPPEPAAVESLLLNRVGPPPSEASSALDIGTNSVLLTLEVALILITTCVAWLLVSRRARRSRGLEQ
jgi:hypothetical protein